MLPAPPAQAPVTSTEIRRPYSRADQDSLFDLLSKLAQETPLLTLDRVTLLESAAQRDRVLKLSFFTAISRQREAARSFLPLVIDKPWLGEVGLPDACAFALMIDQDSPGDAEKVVWAAARRNPDVALREAPQYLSLSFGPRMFERVVASAPDGAAVLAAGSSRSAIQFRALLRASNSPPIRVLADLAENQAIDTPNRGRVAMLYRRIARNELSVTAALKISGSTARYFGALADMRIKASAEEAASLDHAMETEALTFCRAFEDSRSPALSNELAGFPPRDLYLLLAYGRAEVNEHIFSAVFDRLLLPKFQATGKGTSLQGLLDQTGNLKLRDFVASAVAVQRLDAVLRVAGPEVLGRAARGIDQAEDPLQAAVTVAEVIDGAAGRGLDAMATVIEAEFARAHGAGNKPAEVLYSLLAARIMQRSEAAPALREIGERYVPYLTSADQFATALLFGKDNLGVERHFFYDDDDGVSSFKSFKSVYAADSAWKVEDHGAYLRISGEGPSGRRIVMFSNIPIDAHLPVNASHADEAQKSQEIIAQAMKEEGAVASMVVHRGHSFHAPKTIRYVDSSAKLVFLGSCGGVTEIHSVIERSRDAQVIATRGIGTTALNDAILKSLNDRLLKGDAIVEWPAFWQAQKMQLGHNPMFRDYIAPHQDAASVLLRAYYQALAE